MTNNKSKNKRLKLSEEEVQHIAKLAKLVINEEELKIFRRQLSEILDYMEILNEVSTEEVEPTAQVSGLRNIFREDNPLPSLCQSEALFSAPKKYKNFFKTSLILKK